MIFDIIIEKVTVDFNRFFNARDFESLAKLFVNNIHLKTPNISLVYPENKREEIQGISNVIEYWKTLTNTHPDFMINPEDKHFDCEGKHAVYYGRLKNGIRFKAEFHLNEHAKIEQIIVEYMD